MGATFGIDTFIMIRYANNAILNSLNTVNKDIFKYVNLRYTNTYITCISYRR